MKRLLSTTALLAGLAFGGAAYAQTATTTFVYDDNGDQLYTVVDGNGATFVLTQAQFDAAVTAGTAASGVGFGGSPLTLGSFAPQTFVAAPSLLDNILANADALTASITNISTNLADLDASIDVVTDRDYTNIDTIVATVGGLAVPAGGFGTYAQTSATNFASDLAFPDLTFLDPLTAEFGDLATTAIGSLQSGAMDVTYSAGLLADVSDRTSGATTAAETMGQTYGAIGGVSLANISYNQAANIDAGIQLTLNDVNAKTGNIATTAIGSLGSGAMAANIVGALVGTTPAASAVTGG